MPRGNPGRLKNVLQPGARFGELTVVAYAGRRNGRAMWRCICSCSRETVVEYYNLVRPHPPHSRSCGHVRAQLMRAKMLAANEVLKALTSPHSGNHG